MQYNKEAVSNKKQNLRGCLTFVTPTLRKLRQENCHKFEYNFCYIMSYRPAWAIQKYVVSKIKPN